MNAETTGVSDLQRIRPATLKADSRIRMEFCEPLLPRKARLLDSGAGSLYSVSGGQDALKSQIINLEKEGNSEISTCCFPIR
jgi:hypothetical protein